MEKIELKITEEEIRGLKKVWLTTKVLKERQKAGAVYFRAIGKTERQIKGELL